MEIPAELSQAGVKQHKAWDGKEFFSFKNWPGVDKSKQEPWPNGTLAPAIMGGHWEKKPSGWSWNGHGPCFPRPGGDWAGQLLLPATSENLEHLKKRLQNQRGENADTHQRNPLQNKEN